MNIKTIICAVGGAIAGAICRLEQFIPVMLCVITFSGLDFITGLIKGKVRCEISSGRAFLGFWKKLALLMALFLGILLDISLPYLASGTEYASLAGGIAFSGFIGFYIVICEAISIVENLYQCSVPLPGFVIKFLNICKEKINGEEDDE